LHLLFRVTKQQLQISQLRLGAAAFLTICKMTQSMSKETNISRKDTYASQKETCVYLIRDVRVLKKRPTKWTLQRLIAAAFLTIYKTTKRMSKETYISQKKTSKSYKEAYKRNPLNLNWVLLPLPSQGWRNRTQISHEPLVCSKKCFSKTKPVQW